DDLGRVVEQVLPFYDWNLNNHKNLRLFLCVFTNERLKNITNNLNERPRVLMLKRSMMNEKHGHLVIIDMHSDTKVDERRKIQSKIIKKSIVKTYN
ncbi:MAG: hypothetical protein Q4D51_14935, partial [Eubacteriales bacterium]|nr:hypothetical protein [Eubacteriales bacterium]